MNSAMEAVLFHLNVLMRNDHSRSFYRKKVLPMTVNSRSKYIRVRSNKARSEKQNAVLSS